MITKVPILAYYKQSLKTIVESDFSNYVSNAVFSQLEEDRLLYPIVFFSKNLNLTKYNYEIYNKKLLAII